MKYIIEIEDTPFTEVTSETVLYKAKNFNSLVFDIVGLDKLEKFETTSMIDKSNFSEEQYRLDIENAHSCGYQEGYDTATKLEWGDVQYTKGYNQAIADYNEMIEYIFNNQSEFKDFLFEKYGQYGLSDCLIDIQFLNDVALEYDMAEITSELKKWREEKKKAEEDTIKVGDVIYSEMSNDKAVVTFVSGWGNYHCIQSNGAIFTLTIDKVAKYWTKVGHFDEVSQLLDKLRGEDK